MASTMDQFERQFENLDVQSEFVENAMGNQATLSTPEEDVNLLLQQVRSAARAFAGASQGAALVVRSAGGHLSGGEAASGAHSDSCCGIDMTFTSGTELGVLVVCSGWQLVDFR